MSVIITLVTGELSINLIDMATVVQRDLVQTKTPETTVLSKY